MQSQGILQEKLTDAEDRLATAQREYERHREYSISEIDQLRKEREQCEKVSLMPPSAIVSKTTPGLSTLTACDFK